MKKILLILMVVLLMLGTLACGTVEQPAQPAKPTGTATEAPQSTEPEASPQITPIPTTTPSPTPKVVVEYIEAALVSFGAAVAKPKNPYDTEYQASVNAQLNEQIDAGGHTLNSPFISINPYGSSRLCMLLYFEDEPGYVSYTVNSPYSDTVSTKTFDEVSTDHRIEVFGLYPNATNEITVRLYNDNGQLLKQAEYTVDVPSIRLSGVSDPNNPLSVSVVSSTPGVSDGLFGMMGTVESGHGYKNVYFYDNEGYLRGMLDTGFRADTLLQLGDSFLYPYNTRTIVHTSLLGETLAIYRLDGYTMHHDIDVDKDGNIIALVTKNGSGYKEDYMITIDKDTGEIISELDFKTLFGDNRSFFRLNGSDWLHANSIDYIDQKGGNLIISGRETSMIFSVTGVDTGEYALEYIINEGINAQKLDLAGINLAPVGAVNYNLGQHSAYYIRGADENHYQIVYYNNYHAGNNAHSPSGYPDGSFVHYDHIPGADEKSFMTVLDINTQAMIYSEVHTIEFKFSRIRSSAIKYQDNYIASSTQVHQVVEVDAEFNIVLELTLRGSGVYKCNKYKIFD